MQYVTSIANTALMPPKKSPKLPKLSIVYPKQDEQNKAIPIGMATAIAITIMYLLMFLIFDISCFLSCDILHILANHLYHCAEGLRDILTGRTWRSG